MKVIVCGAGQVGSNIARYLGMEDNDVTVIDTRPELVRKLTDSLDVQGVVGHASHPDVLEQAGAGDADMFIAVTYADEVNMVACQVAHSLFHVPTKIARIRHQSYLNPMWGDLFSRDHLPIDVIISPEIEVARAVTRRLSVPGAFEMIPLVGDKVKLLGVRCDENCPLVNTPLRQLTQLFPDLNIVIIGLVRDGKAIVPTSDDQMLEGDEVYFVVDSQHVTRTMVAFGHEESEARRLIVFGGGNIGLFLGLELERDYPWVNTKIIEADAERAELIAKALPNSTIIHGDVLDPDILEEANITAADTVVSVTNDDETNILSSLLAKQTGQSRQRVITLVNKGTYENLVTTLGIDVVVNPRAITVSTILQHVRRGRIHS
ncbi:MAG: Trk system potassium transporter TrkA, partial [Rhodospirillales bacterium]|nr:Trk system potassium transporter TrkA [Rhodospirillales bacterium]